MLFKFRLACSFCGKSAAQVQKLVAGRRAYICDRCAEETMRIMNAAGDPPFQTEPRLLQRLAGRISQLIRHPRMLMAERSPVARPF